MAVRPKVLLTRILPDRGMQILNEHFDLDVNPKDEVMHHRKIRERIQDKEGLICLLTDRIDAEIMNNAPHLKIIANYAVGVDNIDLNEATRRKIAVTNTPDVLTEATADLVFGLLLAIARRIVEADHYVRQGKFHGWSPELLLGNDVNGKTLGIIGLGRIGKAVARRAHGFAMRVIYYDTQRHPLDIEHEYGAEYRDLKVLLSEADFVTVHVPLNENTHHLLSASEFKLMKKSAFLINAARGPVVDERALVAALDQGLIAGCALDVYEHEPHVTAELLHMTNTILVPHIASASVEARTKMAMVVAANVMAMLVYKGRPPNVVNRAIYD